MTVGPMPGVLALEVPCTTTCRGGARLLAVLPLQEMNNKHEIKTNIPNSILYIKELGIISLTDLSHCTDLSNAVTIMLVIVNQRKQVVPKLGE